nr:MAG TPA: dehydrogenase accessory protein [Caudoviricetes sp.]
MRLIDADKLVDMLYENEFAVLCPLDEVSGVIDACPTVDAVPVVHAHRVDNSGFYSRCSECGGVLPYGGNYCPNCGARMDA